MCLSLQVGAGAAAGLPQSLRPAHGDPLSPDEATELAGVLARLRLPVVPRGVDRDAGLQGPGRPAGRPEALDGVGGLGLQLGALLAGHRASIQPLAGNRATP